MWIRSSVHGACLYVPLPLVRHFDAIWDEWWMPKFPTIPTLFPLLLRFNRPPPYPITLSTQSFFYSEFIAWSSPFVVRGCVEEGSMLGISCNATIFSFLFLSLGVHFSLNDTTMTASVYVWSWPRFMASRLVIKFIWFIKLFLPEICRPLVVRNITSSFTAERNKIRNKSNGR